MLTLEAIHPALAWAAITLIGLTIDALLIGLIL